MSEKIVAMTSVDIAKLPYRLLTVWAIAAFIIALLGIEKSLIGGIFVMLLMGVGPIYILWGNYKRALDEGLAIDRVSHLVSYPGLALLMIGVIAVFGNVVESLFENDLLYRGKIVAGVIVAIAVQMFLYSKTRNNQQKEEV